MPQSAGESDSAAVEKVHEQQARMGTQPVERLAGGACGSQANVEAGAARGIALSAPAAGRAKATHGNVPALPGELDQRRALERTAEWPATCRARSGMAGLNAALKDGTGLRRLRVRGERAVGTGIDLKATGWNVQTTSKVLSSRARRARRAAKAAQNPACPQKTRPNPAHPRRTRRHPGQTSPRNIARPAKTRC